jgi:hypothetical protein
MKTIIFRNTVALLFCGIAFSAFAQETTVENETARNGAVETGEFSGLPPVEFVNYAGPYARIDTRAEIRTLGASMGGAVNAGAISIGDPLRYFVIHSVTEPEGAKLDADIFGLGSNASVDHIRNIRLILQGYLETSYGYSENDAALLAEFITVYNAVYRQNTSYFSERFKTAVTRNLTPGHAGLALRYDEWPGQTLMVIPLRTAMDGSLSAVDTTAITSEEVIGRMREEEDRSVPARQDMVELKEREAAEAEEKAGDLRETAAAEETAVAAARETIAAERAEIAAQETPPAQTPATPQTPAAPEEAAAPEAREAELARQEAALDEREEAAAELRNEAAAQDDFAEQKREEAAQERGDIARDQDAIIAGEGADTAAGTPAVSGTVAPAAGIFALRLLGADSAQAVPILLSPDTKAEIRRSGSLTSIQGRTVAVVGSRVYAVAGEARANAAIRLVEIDPVSLDMKKQGEDDIAADSILVPNGADLYAIVTGDGGPFLARFDTELVKLSQSAAAVHRYAFIVFRDGLLFSQRPDGSALLLNPQTLQE